MEAGWPRPAPTALQCWSCPESPASRRCLSMASRVRQARNPLFTDHTTISDYVRPAVRAFPGWALAGAVVIGIGLGHFLWGPASGPASPEGDLMLRGSRR